MAAAGHILRHLQYEEAAMYSRFARWYDRIFPFSPGVYAFLSRHMDRPDGPVLDLGCGTGDYCAAFARDGMRAVGLDLDAAMIFRARESGSGAEFHVLDMGDFQVLGGPWSFIYSIGNTAAHLPPEKFWSCVDNVAACLEPDGTWIVQVMNWDYVLGLRHFTFPPKVMDGAVFHRFYEDISASGLTFRTGLDVDGERVFDDAVRLYPLSSREIIEGHEKRGFRLVEHAADYAGSAFDPEVFSANIFVFRRQEGA